MEVVVPTIDVEGLVETTDKILKMSNEDEVRARRAVVAALMIIEQYIQFKGMKIKDSKFHETVDSYEDALEKVDLSKSVLPLLRKGFSLFDTMTKAFLNEGRGQSFFDQLKTEYKNQVSDYFGIAAETVLQENFPVIDAQTVSLNTSDVQTVSLNVLDGQDQIKTTWQKISDYFSLKSQEASDYVSDKTATSVSQIIAEKTEQVKTGAKYAGAGILVGIVVVAAGVMYWRRTPAGKAVRQVRQASKYGTS